MESGSRGVNFTLQTQDRPKAKDENKQQQDWQQWTPNPECVIYAEKEKTRPWREKQRILYQMCLGKVKNTPQKSC